MPFSGSFRALLCLAGLLTAAAQTPPATPPANPAPATQTAANANAPETTTREQPATFRTSVNMVMVPVVVRDKMGRGVGGLNQEDFQVFDKGKPQIITRFTVEKSGVAIKLSQSNGAKPADKSAEPPVPEGLPERFIAYLFDDVHITFGDLVRVRDAAGRHIDTLAPGDRAAIYTVSGQVMQEFTDDRALLHDALARLAPRPLATRTYMECPDLNYHMADMIRNHNDQILMQALIQETLMCSHLDQTQIQAVQSIIQAAAMHRVTLGEQETQMALGTLRNVLRRMAGMPGQRTLILASPGFITPEANQEKTDIMDRAVRYNVIINAIDARGLYTDPTFDASRPAPASPFVQETKNQYEHDEMLRSADVMAEFALGTGGTFIQNTNDFDAGFRRVATAPEYIYILGFSPQNLKLDGSYHALKVNLKDPAGLTTQARRGYYAPRRLDDPAETAKEEIREAVFSKEEMHELPIDLHTQFFKSSEQNARVTVLMRVDLKNLRFRKAEDRNMNTLTITAALFDRNGNYVVGNQKVLEMRLRDETLEKRADTGFTVRSSFDVKPGTYMVRLVVRDSEGQQMSAANGAVEIP